MQKGQNTRQNRSVPLECYPGPGFAPLVAAVGWFSPPGNGSIFVKTLLNVCTFISYSSNYKRSVKLLTVVWYLPKAVKLPLPKSNPPKTRSIAELEKRSR